MLHQIHNHCLNPFSLGCVCLSITKIIYIYYITCGTPCFASRNSKKKTTNKSKNTLCVRRNRRQPNNFCIILHMKTNTCIKEEKQWKLMMRTLLCVENLINFSKTEIEFPFKPIIDLEWIDTSYTTFGTIKTMTHCLIAHHSKMGHNTTPFQIQLLAMVVKPNCFQIINDKSDLQKKLKGIKQVF